MSVWDYSELDSNIDITEQVEETPLQLEDILKQDFLQLSNVIDEQDLSLLNTTEQNLDLSFLDGTQYSLDTANSLSLVCIDHIKTQISLSKKEQVNSGNPTSLASSQNFIVVGTFGGHILVFDHNDRLKWFLKHETDFGFISALSINKDQLKLICAGGKGAVSLWNLNNGELLRTVENLHAPFSSILSLKYLSDSNFAILSDTSGSVFLLDCRKKDFDSNCIFTGSRGEVLSIEPMLLIDIENETDYSGIESICLMAMATVSKVIVVSLRPGLFVHFTYNLKAPPEYLPLLGWNVSQDEHNRKIVLFAFARCDQIFIYKMDAWFEEKINFVLLHQFKSSGYYLQSMFWIESDSLLLVDTIERAHLIDIVTQEEVETQDISQVELVYESANYKSLINGGYVSRAMAKAGEHACSNSFSLLRDGAYGRLLMLGLHSVFELSLRSWQQRVDYYIQHKRPYCALQLLYNKYFTTKARSHSVGNEIDNMLLNQLLVSMEQAFNCFEEIFFEKDCFQSNDEVNLRKILTIMLKYCVCLPSKYEKIENLFDKLQNNSVAKGVLLESLEHHLFNNHLNNLSPIIVKELMEYYIGKKWYNLLDSIIIHLDIRSLDIDYLVRVSLEYSLYDSYLYVHNVALRDFFTAFDILLQVLHQQIEGKTHYTQDDILLGNKLLVYLSCMLTCIYYPNKGPLHQSEEIEHLEKVYSRMLSSNNNVNVLSVLFQYDCNEFLNLILMAFDFLDQDQRYRELLIWKQTLIDHFLLQIADNESNQFNSDQQNAFFIFLARCLIHYDTIVVSRQYFGQMIDSLFSKEFKRFEERQQILIQLISDSKFEKYDYDQGAFLMCAQRSQMNRICEFIHRSNQNWTELLLVYINDESKHDEVFDHIHFVLSQESTLLPIQSQKEQFMNVIFEKFLCLVQLNATKAVSIFFSYFDQSAEWFTKILERLAKEPSVLYQFLKLTIFETRVNYLNSESASSGAYHKLRDLCLYPEHQARYLELACQFDLQYVVEALDVLQECKDSDALRIFQRYHVKDGEAFIYERSKQYKKSFDLLYDDFQTNLNEMIQNCFNQLLDYESHFKFDMMEDKFTKLLEFCKRCLQYSTEEDFTRKSFFLQLMDLLVETTSSLHGISQISKNSNKVPPRFLHLLAHLDKTFQIEQLAFQFNKQLKLLFEKLINTMLTHISLVDFFSIIVDKVFQHNEELCDAREILLCILENYHYEKTLLELTNNMISCEHHQLLSKFQSCNVRTKSVRYSFCCICLCSNSSNEANDKNVNFVLYNCTHLFHLKCLQQRIKGNGNVKNVNKLPCPLCNRLVDDSTNSSSDENLSAESSADVVVGDLQTKKFNNKLSLNETQFRALNYFHHGRLKPKKGRSHKEPVIWTV